MQTDGDHALEWADAPAGGAALLGFRDCGGLDLRVAAIPAVPVVIEFGEDGLIVDNAA